MADVVGSVISMLPSSALAPMETVDEEAADDDARDEAADEDAAVVEDMASEGRLKMGGTEKEANTHHCDQSLRSRRKDCAIAGSQYS